MLELRASDITACFDEAGNLLSLCGPTKWSFPVPGSLWSLVLSDGLSTFRAIPEAACSCKVETDRKLTFQFHELRLPDHKRVELDTAVCWTLEGGLLQMSISLGPLLDGLVVLELICPDIVIPYREGKATCLLIPREMGCLIHEAAENLPEEGEKLTDLADFHMQCLGWMEEEQGLYFDTRDSKGWIRHWRGGKLEEGRFGLSCSHLLPLGDQAEGGFALPYPITLAPFSGGWFEVAKIYKVWAHTTVWGSRGPDKRRDSYIADIACWLWNRGSIEHATTPARELAKRIGLPVALDWYWWHKHGYDTEYPDYFPPREGSEAFSEAVKGLQKDNVHVQIYTNGMCYDLDGVAWEEKGPQCALQTEDGGYHAYAYNVFTNHRLANTCGASKEWKEIILQIGRKAHALGVEGLYLDMISAVGGMNPCFHPDHGHQAGGGCYGVQGFREILKALRSKYPGLVLSSEATSEFYLDLLEGNITPGLSIERLKWQAEMFGGMMEPVPLFPAVYHGRAVAFGSYAMIGGIPPFDELWPEECRPEPDNEKDWKSLYPDQFAFELARTVSFGNQPMVCNLLSDELDDPALADEVDFLIHLSRFYHTHREYLLWGTMLEPGILQCDQVEVAFLQRFIFTPAGEETELRRKFPAVFHSAWQAPNGERRVVFINFTRNTVKVLFRSAVQRQIEAIDGFVNTDDGIKGVIYPRQAVSLPFSIFS